MRALVVGAGRMGTFHARVLRDLGLDVTTVDPDLAKGADYLSHEDRMTRQRGTPDGFDVVCIATPIEHLVREAAKWHGHRGWLLIEKPAAPTLADAQYLADVLHGQRVAVGYVERFNPRVRRLRELLTWRQSLSAVHFTRWNDRPSFDVALDLGSHDIDLARFLGLKCPVTYDARAGVPLRRRTIAVDIGDRCLNFDLTAHDTSPLHAQWHAFLANRPTYGYATLDDACAVLSQIEAAPLEMAA